MTTITVLYLTDRGCRIENKKFHVAGEGDTLEAAIEDYSRELLIDFVEYGLAPDDELDSKAQELAKRYRAMVEGTE